MKRLQASASHGGWFSLAFPRRPERLLFVARLLRRVEWRSAESFTDSFSRDFDSTSARRVLSEAPSGELLEESLKKLEKHKEAPTPAFLIFATSQNGKDIAWLMVAQ